MRNSVSVIGAAFFAVMAVLIPTSGRAQVLSGSIVGQVLDTTNAGIPGALVRITHRETNQSRIATTNNEGEYSFQSLPGGIYDIAMNKDGFQSFKADAVRLTV